MYTAEQISAAAFNAPLVNVRPTWAATLDALTWVGINTHAVRIGMAATISVETGIFLPIEEEGGWNYYVSILGENQAKWHGYGTIQCTWESNFSHYGQLLGLDLVDHPEILLQQQPAARMAALYFKERGIPAMCETGNWQGVRISVNGGLTHYWDQFLPVVQALIATPESPTPQPAQITTLTVNASLKPTSDHTSTAVADLAAGCVVTFTNDPKTNQVVSKDGLWAHCKVASGITQKKRNATGLQGWLVRADLQTK